MNLSIVKTIAFTAVLALTGGMATWLGASDTVSAADPVAIIAQTADEAVLETAEAQPAPLALSEEARTFIHEEMTTAFEEVVASAEAQGLITAEQAAIMQERGMRPHGGRGMGMGAPMGMGMDPIGRELHQEAMAIALGLTADELAAYHEAGTRLPEILAELGLDMDTVREAVVAAWPNVVAQAVADGRITAEQADLLNTPRGMMGGRGQGNGHGNGHGGRGQGQGQGMPNWAPANGNDS
jgi:hypothetical protein